MTKGRMNRLLVVGAFHAVASLYAFAAVAQPAQPQPGWAPEPYRRPAPRPVPPQLFEPQGPVLSWQALPFTVAAELRTTFVQDAAARRLVGKKAPTGLGLSLSYDAMRLTSKLTSNVDLGWTRTATDSPQPDSNLSNNESFSTDLLTLGLSARYQVFRWLLPYARLAGGIGWDKLTVGNDTGKLDDKHKFAHASLGAGVFVRGPALCLRPSPVSYCGALTGHVEGGYMIGTSSTFSLHSSPGSGVSHPIPTDSVPIGDMGRNAPYLRIALGLAL